MKARFFVFIMLFCLGCVFICEGSEPPVLQKFVHDPISLKLNKEWQEKGEIKRIVDSISEDTPVDDVILQFSFDFQESFIKPLIFLNGEQKNIGRVRLFLTENRVGFRKGKRFIDAVEKYIHNFNLLITSLNLPIQGSPECKEKVCDDEWSRQLSRIVYRYLTHKPSEEKFQSIDEAEQAFVPISKEITIEFGLDLEQRKIVDSFKDFLVQMFTENQLFNVLRVYSKSVDYNANIDKLLRRYFMLEKDWCPVIGKFLEQVKKPESVAQFFYFLSNVILPCLEGKIGCKNLDAIGSDFRNYLTGGQKGQCFEEFSKLLLQLETRQLLDKVLETKGNIFLGTGGNSLSQHIKDKVKELMMKQERRLEPKKELGLFKFTGSILNRSPFFSAMQKRFSPQSMLKIGVAASLFAALYFGYLKNALSRIKNPLMRKKEPVATP